MEHFVLPNNKLSEFLQKIKAGYTLFAPTNNDDIFLFKEIKDIKDVDIEFCNSQVPPKSLLFKQTETLFTFKPGAAAEIDPVKTPPSKRVIFGIRPCDAKSFSIIDKVFNDNFVDPYYAAQREHTILVGLSCIKPEVNCFCTSMDGGPATAGDLDVLLTDIGDKYFVEVQTKKGNELVQIVGNLFLPATDTDKKKKQEIEKKSIQAISRNTNTKGIVEKLDTLFDDELWDVVSLKCLGCGICTYQCPTCHCFDIHDETALTTGARVRVWDTCMNPEYTAQASGYNPRPTRMNRTRNRVYHKFNYYPKNYQVIACVGCGRCITNCPVNIDIVDIIEQVREVKS